MRLDLSILQHKQPSEYQLCFLVQPAAALGLLQVSRRALQEHTQDILDYAGALSRKIDSGSCRVAEHWQWTC